MKEKFFIYIFASCVATYSYSQSNLVKSVFFESNSYTIDQKYIPDLTRIGESCISDSFSLVKIFAYADTKGDRQYNEKLSEKRANAIRSFLLSHFKIDSAKIYVTWLASAIDSAYDLHFHRANIQNRCADILVYYSKSSIQK